MIRQYIYRVVYPVIKLTFRGKLLFFSVDVDLNPIPISANSCLHTLSEMAAAQHFSRSTFFSGSGSEPRIYVVSHCGSSSCATWDAGQSDSLDNLILYLVSCEIWTLFSSHELPFQAMSMHLLFARLLGSLQPISCSFEYCICCCPYLSYHSLLILSLFINYTFTWSHPTITHY